MEAKDKGFSSIAFVCPTTQSAIALDVAVNALNGEEVQPEYLASEDPVTEENVDSVYREDLSDNFWPAGTRFERGESTGDVCRVGIIFCMVLRPGVGGIPGLF